LQTRTKKQQVTCKLRYGEFCVLLLKNEEIGNKYDSSNNYIYIIRRKKNIIVYN
jgi:hypothetical protein